MRIIIIGAVAAGPSAAAKARRNNEEASIVIYEKSAYISYSACTIPYYLGGVVKDVALLTPRDPAAFKRKYNVDVLTLHEVLSIDPDTKTVSVRDIAGGEIFTDHYDKLVIATGASAVAPPIEGMDGEHVFTLRDIDDMNRIQSFIDAKRPASAAIVGTGFIGLEMCENLKALGMKVTLFERLPQVTPGLDADMAVHVQDHVEQNDVEVFTGVSVTKITKDGVVLEDGRAMEADLVLVSTGVRPNTKIAAEAGVELGVAGAIRVDARTRTNLPDIYACGDCAEQFHAVTGKPVYRPLGTTANKMGRVTGENVTGGDMEFRGVLGTGIFQVFDRAVGLTGLSEREAKELGYDVVVSHDIKPDKPRYMGGQDLLIKAVADKATGRLLGAQIIGRQGVDKRLDVFATTISFKAKVEDLYHLDLGYAPPFSLARDPVLYTGMILDNAINKGRPLITADELDELIKSGKPYTLIDATEPDQHKADSIDTAHELLCEELRTALPDSVDKDSVIVTYCEQGEMGGLMQNILINKGCAEVYNLSGGQRQYAKCKGEPDRQTNDESN
ncbi:MAG: FAD-dependent oxidoreductase [Fastidiosipilaceae bacterium]|jgi:NADPH-dependent 2,4-dienoyl-CoA reductase/sulfur reductase-like enzyme/rhodanese-related sulfurtransferase